MVTLALFIGGQQMKMSSMFFNGWLIKVYQKLNWHGFSFVLTAQHFSVDYLVL